METVQYTIHNTQYTIHYSYWQHPWKSRAGTVGKPKPASMSGRTLPDEKITDPKYENLFTLSTCSVHLLLQWELVISSRAQLGSWARGT